MLIGISVLIFFATALALVILKIYQPNARYAWLIAVGGAMLATLSVFLWFSRVPIIVELPAWQLNTLLVAQVRFHADRLSLPYAASLSVLTLAILLTAASRPVFINSLSWAGTLSLGGLGLLAITADNPLTLLLVWGALDMTELMVQLSSVNDPAGNEKVVISFSTRAIGIGLLIWANVISLSSGNAFNFQSIAPQAGLYLIAAAGLRLGVLPLHLPYSSESTLRRGFGTALRMVSAASSLVLLAYVPAGSLTSALTPFLMILSIVAAVYGGWMWLRAPDELNARPYWVIGIAALSIIAALSGNPLGSVAWGCALVLVGGSLFLSSVQNLWLNRALLIGALSLSSLPFTLTAGGWLRGLGWLAPFVIAAQALLMAGFVRHALRASSRDSLLDQPNWARTMYAAGIGLLLFVQVLLGLLGWDGAGQIGAWLHALIASLLTVGLVYAAPRFRIFNPIRAHWVNTSSPQLGGIYNFFWSLYRGLGQISQSFITMLEGDGGIMWTLLFLILFVSLMSRGTP
jgi:hypothetical protein